MEELLWIIGIILVAYVWPLAWCWSFYLRDSRQDFYAVFGFMPLLNWMFVAGFYESREEDKKREERRKKGQEKAEASKEFYVVVMEFLDGSTLETDKIGAKYIDSYFGGAVIDAKHRAEARVDRIINREYYSHKYTKYPYHTMNKIYIKDVSEEIRGDL